jgi:kinesin family protein 2/24
LINSHRRHIDEVVDLVKEEMVLLNDVDKPGSDVEDYVK